MIVYQPGLMPIGTVDEVHDKNSRVKLLSANDSELESFVASSSLVVRLHGDGGGDFVATLPKDAPASIGDTLMWKDHPHMTLGTVIRIDNQPQAVSQTIYVRGAYNPSVHVQLYILTP
jgi:cell shape-determining protein MreC